MISKIIVAALMCLLFVAQSQVPLIQINSSHTHNSFHVSFSIEANQKLQLYSRKIVNTQSHWTQVDTNNDKTIFNPELKETSILVNGRHQGRNWIEFYQQSKPSEQRHFIYLQVKLNDSVQGYLLPTFSHKVPALKIDSLYRCSDALISITRMEGDAHIVVFSEKDVWRVHQDIDDGFRGGERNIFYGYAADFDHVNPVKIQIGDHNFCLIDSDTPTAKINVDWKSRQQFDLNQLLHHVGQSLPVERRKPQKYHDEL